MLKLVSNKIRCKFCGDIIESFSVHDFKRCRCGKCSTDGGLEYAQRSFFTENPEDTYEDLSIYRNDDGKLIYAKDADSKDIPFKPIRFEIKPVEVKEDAVWEPWTPSEKELEKNEDGTVCYPHAGTYEIIDKVADETKESKAEAEEEEVVIKKDKNGKPVSGRYPYGNKK